MIITSVKTRDINNLQILIIACYCNAHVFVISYNNQMLTSLLLFYLDKKLDIAVIHNYRSNHYIIIIVIIRYKTGPKIVVVGVGFLRQKLRHL